MLASHSTLQTFSVLLYRALETLLKLRFAGTMQLQKALPQFSAALIGLATNSFLMREGMNRQAPTGMIGLAFPFFLWNKSHCWSKA
jgi:hypothetical protein